MSIGDSLVRFFTGDDKPRHDRPGVIERYEPNEVELGERHLHQMQLKGMQMGMDEVLTRMAIGQIVGINNLVEQVAGNNEHLGNLIRPIQQAHSERMANYVRGK